MISQMVEKSLIDAQVRENDVILGKIIVDVWLS